MATWHQLKNKVGMKCLYIPHDTSWKVVDDKPNQFASAMLFMDKVEAERYANKTGGLLIPPKEEQ